PHQGARSGTAPRTSERVQRETSAGEDRRRPRRRPLDRYALSVAVLPIRMFPDPVLREPAAPVTVVDDSVRKLISDMAETMKAAEGAGLAAPQIGVQRRVFVYKLGDEEGEIHALINPEIVEREGTITADEGCLS